MRHVCLLCATASCFVCLGLGPRPPRVALRAQRDPWAVLELDRGSSRDAVKRAFREKIRKAHPDAGGSAGEFNEARAPDLLVYRFGRFTWRYVMT